MHPGETEIKITMVECVYKDGWSWGLDLSLTSVFVCFDTSIVVKVANTKSLDTSKWL